MSTESPVKDTRALPEAPQPHFSPAANEPSHEPMVSTGATGTQDATNTNTISGVYTNTIHIQPKDHTASIRVPRVHWKSFLQKSRELGYSGNELINYFIIAVLDPDYKFPARTPVTFNIAIAKAESKPVINVGEYVALKQLNDFLAESKKLRDRADRERVNGQVLTFTKERAKSLEEGLLKALKSLRSLPPEKLQEVEAAIAILKGIREARP